MKKYIYIVITIFLAACHNLDVAPLNIIQDKDVFNSEAGVTAYMATIYQSLPMEDFYYRPDGNGGSGFCRDWQLFYHPGTLCGELVGPYGGTGDAAGGFGYWPYDNIRTVNYLLTNLPVYAKNLSSDKINQWLGEAYFCWAYLYFSLVKRYVGVPIIKTIQNYPEQSIKELQVSRDKEEDVWNFIGSDLDSAYDLTPGTSDRGRANRYVAAAFKSRAMLYAGSIAKYGSTNFVAGDAQTQQTSGENRDYASLILPGNQEKLLEAACATGKPVILILQSGRPYDLSYAAQHCSAIIVNWLPGQEGGPATADILFGDYNPAGRLPMTFPRNVSQEPLYYNFKTSGRSYNYVDMQYYPLYPFGYGLSYTTFNYSNLKTNMNDDGTVSVKATVTNTGKIAGDEVAQLYVTDMYASVKTRVMELKDFNRIYLTAGEAKEVSFTLTPYQLSLLNDLMDRVVEPGEFKIMVGGKSPSYIASDKIKNSVGFKTSAEGVNTTIDYKKSFNANFIYTIGKIDSDPISGKKRIAVMVKNRGNLTDVGKLTMYADGVMKDEIHHYELAPGEEKPVYFNLDGISSFHNLSFAGKYKIVLKSF